MTTGHPKVEGIPKLSVWAWVLIVSSCLFFAKARSFPNGRDIFAAISQRGSKWNPAGLTVQLLLAAHCTVIETFISPLVVREGMSINGTHSHHENFGDRSSSGQLSTSRPSEVCQGQGWAEMKPKALFLYLKLCSWADSLFLLLINKKTQSQNELYKR